MPPDPDDAVLRRLTDRLAPLERDLHHAVWAALTDARPETSAAKQRAEAAWLAALGDPELFAEVQGALAADRAAGTGRWIRRSLEQASLDLLANQIPEGDRAELVALQARVEHAFASVRGQVGDRELGNNELEQVLADSTDPAERRAAWEAGKQVGAVVADDVLALVELRNRVARERGHRDWFAFALAAGDVDEAWLERMLDEVELATREPFLAAKAELDARLAARFGVAVDDLYPWHYGDLFFQRYHGEGEAGLGPLLEGGDTVALTVAAYDGMGLETRHLLERSDLHPRPGKDQHAFCLDLDRAGDIRVLANLAPGEESLDVLLHEVGHAVYDDHIDRSLPWVLRRPPQPLVTEAVALMLGRLRRDPEFLVGVLGADQAAARALTGPSREVLRTGYLVFARWCLVVVRFERAMYSSPGGDLVGTWWDLVSSLQGLRRPEGRTAPDWASKIHLAVAPVYYHSYLLGELFASQLDQAVRDHAGGFVGRPDAGRFLTERVFAPGATQPWRDLVASATGSSLGPAAFLAGLAA
jgi:peptidyl-dipeptidase A